MNKSFIQQINESVSLVEASTPKWLLKMVKNPKTGNMVQVRSLDPADQEKYRPKKLDKKHVKDLAKKHGLGRWSVRGDNELINKDTGERFEVESDADLVALMKGKKPAASAPSNVIPLRPDKAEPKKSEPVKPSEDLWRELGLNSIKGRSYSSFGFGPSRSPEKWQFHGDDAELELDRYRRHDHGGGPTGDEWLPDHEVERDREQGMKTYGYLKKDIKDRLNKAGYDADVDFDLGEKGHFRVVVFNLRKEKK